MNKIKEFIYKNKYYFVYTFVFLICCLSCFYVYYSNGKSFIYDGDGWSQHYKAYVYYGRYLRQILSNIFVEHNFVIPQWDFSIGEGADILASFSYYCIGDPITLLCALFSDKTMYILYRISVILRLYLSGICFSKLCFYKNHNNVSTLAGAITYTFCFWSLFNSVRHIYFLNSMIYMPLVALGVEKIFNKDNPYLLTFSVLVSCISNFYFFYNIVILTIVYVLVRFIFIYFEDNNIKNILVKLVTIIKYSALGVLIGSFIFIPILIVFLQDSRMGIEFGKHLIYPLNYYLKIPSMFISTSREYWLCMGYASPIILAIVSLFINWKKNKQLALLTVLGFVMIMFPIFGQFMNGMSYISNKWCFALSLLLSYVFTSQWNELTNNRTILIICSSLLLLISIVLGFGRNMIVPIIICFLFSIVIFLRIKWSKTILVFLIMICVIFNADNQYSIRGTNYSSSATTYQEDIDMFTSNEAYSLINNIDDEEFYRYSGSCISQNTAIIARTNSTDYYWSLGNPNISEYRNDLAINEYLLQKYYGYDQRSTLYTLANVKYYIVPKGSTELIPLGFKYLKSFDEYDLYINENNLPFGYTYSKTYSYDQWQKLNSVEKEEVLSKAIVLEESSTISLNTNIKSLDYEIVEQNGLRFEEGFINVLDDDAYLKLKILSQDGELYITFDGLTYDDNKSWIKDKNTATTIEISTDNCSKKFDLYSNDDRYYNGRTTFTNYLGYQDSNEQIITISFKNKGNYYCNDIFVSLKPIDDYSSDIEKLKEDVLTNVVFDTNKVTGSISLKEDKYLLLSIPYSKGWKAYVNGEVTELLKANEAYMAIDLKAGTYDIELRYETPYLKEGLLVSLGGIVLLVIDIICKERGKKYGR